MQLHARVHGSVTRDLDFSPQSGVSPTRRSPEKTSPKRQHLTQHQRMRREHGGVRSQWAGRRVYGNEAGDTWRGGGAYNDHPGKGIYTEAEVIILAKDTKLVVRERCLILLLTHIIMFRYSSICLFVCFLSFPVDCKLHEGKDSLLVYPPHLEQNWHMVHLNKYLSSGETRRVNYMNIQKTE